MSLKANLSVKNKKTLDFKHLKKSEQKTSVSLVNVVVDVVVVVSSTNPSPPLTL